MDEAMKKFQQDLVEVEIEAENLLLARHELVEIDRVRNSHREASTALRKRARTTKTSVPLPFEPIMRDIESKPLIKEVCATCGDHDSWENTWFMFPGTDLFATVPFHAAHTILETDQARLNYESKKLQSCVKEKSFFISEKGVLSDKISPGVMRSLLTLSDKPKTRGSGSEQIGSHLTGISQKTPYCVHTVIQNTGLDYNEGEQQGLCSRRNTEHRAGLTAKKNSQGRQRRD
ncbi:hypothetical protein F511_10991 [Dorcoceras hygrometricum]|uniref:Uncharacterized protein n=1 Tax=Dorcoceras hygrometricum TaxID=472368 RepID=A0A2Z7CPQ1_9LAMI|nr:hypothetical protein F511_10991 [Dorcoceras hygrometricum]